MKTQRVLFFVLIIKLLFKYYLIITFSCYNDSSFLTTVIV